MSAVEHGADAIGLIFYPPSPRAVTLGQAQGIVAGLPESVTVVAVLVNPDLALVEAVLELGIVDCLQFHGEESAAFCEQFDTPYMKAIRVQEGMNLVSKTSEYTKACAILLDSYVKSVQGGSGESFNWSLAKSLVDSSQQKIVLAGGLSALNVKQAIMQVRPFGVDVVSGVESSPGHKDLEQLRLFFEGVNSVE
jgi:phosphoribosylanthranilate isomerase